jgi:hypothetical protein
MTTGSRFDMTPEPAREPGPTPSPKRRPPKGRPAQRYRTNKKPASSPSIRELDRQMRNVYELDNFAPAHPSTGPYLDDGEPIDESKYLIHDHEEPDHGAR